MIENRFSRKAAVSLVVANMIGTGVFTSLGFQLADIRSVFALMMLWLVGGIAALCGALTYAELGANLPRSGGEYNFLTRLYHPAVGFISGWISVTVGFAAPIALAAMTFGAYLSASVDGVSPVLAASLLVMTMTVLHCFSRKASGSAQDADILFGGAFAVSLIYVNYAYMGWNAATYITSELDDPQRSLPMILFVGTLFVMLIYLALNFVFLYTAPMDSMQGKIEIGVIVAERAFGEAGGKAMGIGLALLLISTVSAMVIAGPRVLQVIGEDFAIFRFLSATNKNGVPAVAIVCLGTLSIVFILTATFESILVFSGFILGVNTLFTVIGVFVIRWRKLNIDGAYRTFGYPVTPIIYLLITLWTLSYILINRPEEGWAGIAMIVTGLLMYFVSKRVERYQAIR